MDRILTPDLSLETATLCAMVSMDSTMNSNMTVGPPIEVTIYPADSYSLERYYCFEEHSEYLTGTEKKLGQEPEGSVQQAAAHRLVFQLGRATEHTVTPQIVYF